VVDLAGDVALEDADDVGLRLAFLEAAGDVGPRARVGTHPGDDYDPQRRVGLAVAAAVEPPTGDLAGRGRDRGDAAQVGPRGFGAEPVGVVAGGHQQRGGSVDADAVQLEQLGCGLGDELGEQRVEALLFLVEGDHAPSQHSGGCLGRIGAGI
jgi:hypothetical protein